MPKQQITIEVDVPEGWEVIDYRKPRHDEHFVSNGAVFQSVGESCMEYAIIRKTWQWPEWLKAKWIAMSKEGRWFACDAEPFPNQFGWKSDCFEVIDTRYYDFTPPPCTDWRQSKRRRPQ